MNENRQQPNRDEQHPGVPVQWEATPPAGTTQHVKHGDVPSIEITLRQAEALVDVFGGHDAEVSIIQRPDAWPHMDLGLYAYFTEYPGEGSFYLGPTEVDDDLAANGRAPAATIKTWRERLGRPADFPLHAPTDVERAMEAEIAERRAREAQRVASAPTQLPPLDAELRAILGRPNFNCIQIAARMRELGHEIETRAEHEQAAVIHLLLGFYLKHGAIGWFDRANEYLGKGGGHD